MTSRYYLVERRRKCFPEGKLSKTFVHEAAVASLLVSKQPYDNVVCVYDVTADTITEQKLDTLRKFDKENEADLFDVRDGIDSLHDLGIVHLDLYERNFGWDKKRDQWCLFDFDVSGIVHLDSPDQWYLKPRVQPRSVNAYMKRAQIAPPGDLRELDWIMFESIYLQGEFNL